MTKTIIELAREAAALKGHTLKTVLERETVEFIESFAALHRDEIIAELCKGVEMPEPVAQLHPNHWKPNPDGSEWCREALLYSPNNEGDQLRGVNVRVKLYTADQLRDYAAAAVLREREQCANVCDGRIGGAVQSNEWWVGFKSATKQCAAAIRDRSKE